MEAWDQVLVTNLLQTDYWETPFRRTMGNYKGNHWGANGVQNYSAKGKLKCHCSTKARTNASWSLKMSIWDLKGLNNSG